MIVLEAAAEQEVEEEEEEEEGTATRGFPLVINSVVCSPPACQPASLLFQQQILVENNFPFIKCALAFHF